MVPLQHHPPTDCGSCNCNRVEPNHAEGNRCKNCNRKNVNNISQTHHVYIECMQEESINSSIGSRSEIKVTACRIFPCANSNFSDYSLLWLTSGWTLKHLWILFEALVQCVATISTSACNTNHSKHFSASCTCGVVSQPCLPPPSTSCTPEWNWHSGGEEEGIRGAGRGETGNGVT